MNIKRALISLFLIILVSAGLGLAEVKKEVLPNGRLKADGTMTTETGRIGKII